MKKLLVPLVTFAIGFAAVIGGLYSYQLATRPPAPPVDLPSLLWPNPKQIGDFALLDQHRQAFNLARIKGQWTFWYFGYTSCPDACPMTMTVMNGLDRDLARTPQSHAGVQFSFVSVDPARDNIEHLAKYVSFFNPGIIAATAADPAQLDALTRQFGVLYNLQDPDENGNYVVDHTAALLLTDPEARLVGIFQAPHDVASIADSFRRIRRFIEG